MFWFFGHEAFGILAPRPGIKPAPPALEGEVLTTGPWGSPLSVHFNKMPLNHFVCLGFTYYLQKNKEVRPDILKDFFSAVSQKNLWETKQILFQGICLHLAQIMSSNVLLTFCGFRTLMTCVMVPVLNAGTMLLLGDRSCSWNVWGEQRALFRKIHFTLCQRC